MTTRPRLPPLARRRRPRAWQLAAAVAWSLCLIGALACSRSPDNAPDSTDGDRGPRLSAVEALGARAAEAPDPAWDRADGVRPFVFPRDHGPHPDFQTEWWYLTGHLDAADGRSFGFQWTLFRRGLRPPAADETLDASGDSERPDEASWATRQLYMGHFAVGDLAGDRFHSAERFARGAAGLAGAIAPVDAATARDDTAGDDTASVDSDSSRFRVWVEDWSLESARVPAAAPSRDGDSIFPLRLDAADDGVALSLRLDAGKPKVLQGDRGFSRKSSLPGGASYYYTYPRMPVTGTVRFAPGEDPEGGTEEVRVTGEAWLDREWSTSVLAPEQTGWDWFALQLDDGREWMLYQLRLESGGVDDAGAAIRVDREGQAEHFRAADFQIEPTATWRSPRSGVTYPSRWRITAPSTGLDLVVEAAIADQELDVAFRYWEGAVTVEGRDADGPVKGRGFVELVGYDAEP